MSTGTLSVLDHTGDTRIEWDEESPAEVAAAEEHFKTMLKKGYLAYTVDRQGGRGQQIREFDRTAERIIMSPALQGG